jgi:hypothetical protein
MVRAAFLAEKKRLGLDERGEDEVFGMLDSVGVGLGVTAFLALKKRLKWLGAEAF